MKASQLNINLFSVYLLAGILFACVACDGVPQVNTPLVYPDATSERFVLYKEKCGLCHVAPLPMKHTEKQWPHVVDRMKMHMTRKSVQPLNDNHVKIILGYLQEHAKL